MRAGILAVGSELLGTDRLDTNSLGLTAVLRRYGVELRHKAVVGDDAAEISELVRRLASTCELVLVTGGLGPTSDDVTREAVAAAFGFELSEDAGVLAGIAERFASMGRRMPDVNRRQAQLIAGATLLENPRGTAPGQQLQAGRATIFLFPGVPIELEGMITADLVPWLAARCGDATLETATVRIACLPESEVEERIAPAYAEFGREAITVLAAMGDIRVRLSASGPERERRARLGAMSARIAELAGAAVYSFDEEEDLPSVVVAALGAAGATLGIAESCTGGLAAERITRVPGSSAVFLGGVVAYGDDLKRRLLGVPAALLAEHGAVSEPVARALAEGARRVIASDWGIGITGVAGPGGGSAEKPVGTVHIAVAGPVGTEHRLLRFPGRRRQVRELASQVAFEMLRRGLKSFGESPDGSMGGTVRDPRRDDRNESLEASDPDATNRPPSATDPEGAARLFVALELPPSIRAELGRRLEPLRPQAPRARWVAPEKLHLTLLFLGATPRARLPALIAALRGAFATEPPLSLQVAGGGGFPARRPPRVVWAGVEPSRDLAPLQERVAAAARRELGRAPGEPTFHPHVTVARLNQPWRDHLFGELERALAGPVGEPFPVERGVLFESTPGRGGTRYQMLAELPMGVVA
jgi:2'-5' RNA ligase